MPLRKRKLASQKSRPVTTKRRETEPEPPHAPDSNTLDHPYFLRQCPYFASGFPGRRPPLESYATVAFPPPPTIENIAIGGGTPIRNDRGYEFTRAQIQTISDVPGIGVAELDIKRNLNDARVQVEKARPRRGKENQNSSSGSADELRRSLQIWELMGGGKKTKIKEKIDGPSAVKLAPKTSLETINSASSSEVSVSSSSRALSKQYKSTSVSSRDINTTSNCDPRAKVPLSKFNIAEPKASELTAASQLSLINKTRIVPKLTIHATTRQQHPKPKSSEAFTTPINPNVPPIPKNIFRSRALMGNTSCLSEGIEIATAHVGRRIEGKEIILITLRK